MLFRPERPRLWNEETEPRAVSAYIIGSAPRQLCLLREGRSLTASFGFGSSGHTFASFRPTVAVRRARRPVPHTCPPTRCRKKPVSLTNQNRLTDGPLIPHPVSPSRRRRIRTALIL